MTKPRNSVQRELYGILGSYPQAGKDMAWWNASFSKQGIDAWMSKYPTTVKTLPERLSEMFHFDRRAYIVSPALEKAVLSSLDRLEESAKAEGRVNTILNEKGVFVGAFLTEQERQAQWLSA